MPSPRTDLIYGHQKSDGSYVWFRYDIADDGSYQFLFQTGTSVADQNLVTSLWYFQNVLNYPGPTTTTGSVIDPALVPSVPSTFPDGSAAAPSITFTNDTDTGFYRPGSNVIGVTNGGVQTAEFNSSAFRTLQSIHAANGSIGNPSIAFFADQTTGFYRHGSNEIGVAVNGALVARFNSAGLLMAQGITSTLGTITTSTPMLAGTQTWNAVGTTFTGFWLNVTDTSSAAGSLLADLQIGSASQFKVDKNGNVTAGNTASGGQRVITVNDSGGSGGYIQLTAPGLSARFTADYVGSVTTRPFGIYAGGGIRLGLGDNSSANGFNAVLPSNYYLGWAAGTSISSGNFPVDTAFYRNAAGVIEINNGTAGTFRDLKLRALTTSGQSLTTSDATSLLDLSTTWNTTGNPTAIKLNVTNTASGSSSLLMDLQRDSTSQFKVDKSGNATAAATIKGTAVSFNNGGIGADASGNTGLWMDSYLCVAWALQSGASYGTKGVTLDHNANYSAEGQLAQIGGNGNRTQAQGYLIYNTWSSATNYERLGLKWTSNVAQIYTEAGSGGGTARSLVLGTNGTTALTISATDQSITTAAALSDSIGNVRSIPQNAQTAAYVLAATDNGKHVSITTGGVTVNSGIFTAGQVVTIFNNSSSNQTITQGTSVTMYQAGTTNTGNRTLASYGVATVLCVASNTFVITGSGLS